jgi:hypothetical protein
MLCKRRHTDTPIRFPSRPIFIATLRQYACYFGDGTLVHRLINGRHSVGFQEGLE